MLVRESQVRRFTATPNFPYDHFGLNRKRLGLTRKQLSGLMIGDYLKFAEHLLGWNGERVLPQTCEGRIRSTERRSLSIRLLVSPQGQALAWWTEIRNFVNRGYYQQSVHLQFVFQIGEIKHSFLFHPTRPGCESQPSAFLKLSIIT